MVNGSTAQLWNTIMLCFLFRLITKCPSFTVNVDTVAKTTDINSVL